MDKARIDSIKERFRKVKEPVEVYNEQGQLKKVIMPYSGLGNFEVEIIYSRDELCKNETI
jgi:ACT domain-containing protein